MESKVNPGRLPILKSRLNQLAKRYDSITEFATALDISRQTVGFWLNGNRLPDAESLMLISTRMDVSVDWLLGLTDVENYSNEPEMRVVCEYTGLTKYAVSALNSHMSSPEFISYLIANANLIDKKSFLYYLKKAVLIAKTHSHYDTDFSNINEDNSHIEYIRDSKDGSFGIKLNAKESVLYLLEKAKEILSLTIEHYVLCHWEGKTPDSLIDRFKAGVIQLSEDGDFELFLNDDGSWEKTQNNGDK